VLEYCQNVGKIWKA